MAEPIQTPTPGPQVQAYDSQTNMVVSVSPEDIKANPSRLEPVQSQPTYMQGPDGKAYQVEAHQAQNMVDAGFSFLTPQQAEHQKAVEFYRKQYDSDFEVGAKEAVNQLSFGVGDVVSSHDNAAKQEGIKLATEAHKTAQYIGGAAGFAAGALATGGIGKALQGAAGGAQLAGKGAQAAGAAARTLGAEAGAQAATAAIEQAAPGLLTRMGTAAGKAALEGAAYTAPSAITQAAYGDVNEAAENMLWGAGIGGVIGAGAGAFSEATRAGKDALRGAAIKTGFLDEAGKATGKLTGMADSLTGQAMGLTGEAAEKIGAEGLGTLKNTFGKTRPTAETVQQLQKESTEQLAAHASSLDGLLSKAPAETRKTIEATLPTAGGLAQKVQSTLLETHPNLSSPLMQSERRAVDSIVNGIAEHGSGPMTPGKLYDLSSTLAQKAEGASGVNKRVLDQVQSVVRAETDRAMTESFNQLGLSKEYAEYLATRQKQQVATQLMQLGPGAFGAGQGAQMLGELGSSAGKALVGAAIGGGITHDESGALLGLGMGAAKYHVLSPIAQRLLSHVAVEKGLPLAANALRKIASNPGLVEHFGAALAKDATDAARQKLTSLPVMLGSAAYRNRGGDAIKSMLGPQANGLSKEQQYDKLTQAISNAASDPDRMAEQVGHMNQLFGYHPELQNAMAAKMTQAVGYLHETMPKAPAAIPFQKQDWKPSAADKKTFNNRVETVNNPWAVMDHVNSGTLTKEHVETLAAVYPQLHAQMQDAVQRLAMDPNAPNLSNGVKQSLSLLTGVNLSNPTSINYQAVYRAPQGPGGAPQGPPQQGPGKPAKGHGGGGSAKQVSFDKLPSLATPTQRRSNFGH